MSGLPSAADAAAPNFTQRFKVFTSIPPERIGLSGEYDHAGLAKRVMLALEHSFSIDDLRTLNVTQRGGVVVLNGWVSSRAQLERMVAIARSVHGATDVEAIGVNLRQFDALESAC